MFTRYVKGKEITLFGAFCPFCGLPMQFLEEQTRTVKECPMCGAEIAFEEYMNFEKNTMGYNIIPNFSGESFEADGFVVKNGLITEYRGDATEIITPENIIAIGENVFKNNKRIKSVTITPNVKYIGHYAFHECGSLRKLVLSEGIIAIGNAAFAAPRSFAEEVERYLATHPVAGMESYADFCRLLAQPAAEGTVDTNIDPDYGIELASNWSLSVNNGAQTNTVIINDKAQTVSGYFAYEVDFFDIENIVGFGKRNKEITLGTLRTIAEEFRGTGIFGPSSDSNDIYCEEVYYQADALRELAMLPDSCRLEGIFHRMEMENNMYYIYDNWSHPDAKLTADRGVILFTNAQRTVAYVIVTP